MTTCAELARRAGHTPERRRAVPAQRVQALRPVRLGRSAARRPDAFLALQRSAGNRAVRTLMRDEPARGAGPAPPSTLDPLSTSISPEVAAALSNEQLESQVQRVRAAVSDRGVSSAGAEALQWNLRILETEVRRRSATEEGAYPRDVALFSTWLVRGGYIEEVASLLPQAWRGMTDSELTAYLQQRFSEAQLRDMFLAKYEVRAEIKARFRKLNIVAAIVVGLLWARENVMRGEWGTAIGKVGGSALTAWLFNRLLYARDPAAHAIMAARAGEFGRWFAGAARSNRIVNFLARRVAGALLLWDIKDVFMSGGMGAPNIPFDLIYDIDIDDPSTWREPNQTLLDLGFSIWYRQVCTDAHREACGPNQVYLGMVEGSLLAGLGRFADLLPRTVPELRQRLYRVEGPWDLTYLVVVSFIHRTVDASENVLVIATGKLGGEQVGHGGHYREVEVLPANQAAIELFGGVAPRFVPSYLLHQPPELEPGR